jgi:hypothetical protein
MRDQDGEAGLCAGLFAVRASGWCHLLPSGQQTVDGCKAALEIHPRSSYVPD